MKKVIDVSIGGSSFTIEEEAYLTLKAYLHRFQSTISDPQEAGEVMEDIEARIGELFRENMKFNKQVVDEALVQQAIDLLGDVPLADDKGKNGNRQQANEQGYTPGKKVLFCDPYDKKLGGVCSGLSFYLGIDATLIRLLFVFVVLFGGSGILLYIVLWIILPKALSVPQRLQMMGYATTADNIRRYNATHRA